MVHSFDPAELVQTGNKYADQYIAAARQLKLDVEIISEARTAVLISATDNAGNRKELTVTAAILGCNNLVATRISSNKFITSTRLHRAGFRVPPFTLFSTADYASASEMLDDILASPICRFPVVIKPVKGNSGTHVYAGIEDIEELRWTIDAVWQASLGELMLEQHIPGKNYRIKLFDGEITDLLLKTPGHIVGDGSSTIQQLIDEKNEEKALSQLGQIIVTERMIRIIERSGHTLDTVLPCGFRQRLSFEANQAGGGDSESVDIKSINQATAKYFAKVADFSGLRWLGLDFIVDDISAADAHLTGMINETNSAPGPQQHEPGITRDQYLYQAALVLESYFEL